MSHPLDNVVWRALTGAHAGHAAGTDVALRYASGFSPIAAFAAPDRPDLAALAPFCEPGEHLYCMGWPGGVPDGWNVDADATMYKMIWDAPTPTADAAPEALPLGPEHAARAVELTALTQPGPFGPRTVELGDYFGIFDGPRLVAMAGERFQVAPYREISGVCTDPAYQGRGFARRLMLKLVRRQLLRGETPFLHVMRDNTGARSLYARMGFRDFREDPVRVISRVA